MHCTCFHIAGLTIGLMGIKWKPEAGLCTFKSMLRVAGLNGGLMGHQGGWKHDWKHDWKHGWKQDTESDWKQDWRHDEEKLMESTLLTRLVILLAVASKLLYYESRENFVCVLLYAFLIISSNIESPMWVCNIYLCCIHNFLLCVIIPVLSS